MTGEPGFPLTHLPWWQQGKVRGNHTGMRHPTSSWVWLFFSTVQCQLQSPRWKEGTCVTTHERWARECWSGRAGSYCSHSHPRSGGLSTKCTSQPTACHGLDRASCILCHWPCPGAQARGKRSHSITLHLRCLGNAVVLPLQESRLACVK